MARPLEMFFDLLKELTTNTEFMNRVSGIMTDMVKADLAKNKDAYRYHMTELLRTCDYNPSLLVPYFFPAFPEDKPMTLWTRPHAMSMMAFVPNGTLTVLASRQIGKCVGAKTELLVKKNNEVTRCTIKELFDKTKNKN